MNIIQAVKYMMRVLIPSITPVAGEGIMVAKEKEGSVISATFPGWVPHDMVYVANATNAAWTAGTVVLLGATSVADPEDDTLVATIPAAGADGQFAILADDIAAGSDGLAAVTGLAVAKMSAGFTEAFAAPDGLGGLAGAASGPFRVIYANSTTQTALVAFAGGSGRNVTDNTPDIFKISKLTDSSVSVSGGTIVNGSSLITCSGATIWASTTGRYIYVDVTYSNSAYSASISFGSVQYPTEYNRFRYTLGYIIISNGELKIEQWHSPAPIYIHDRWF